MPKTQVPGSQVKDGSVTRSDLNVATAGQAVVRKLVQGTGIVLNSDGVDSGTGDVTINGIFILDGNNNLYSSNAAVPLGSGNFFAGLNAGFGNEAIVEGSIWIGGNAGYGATLAVSSMFLGTGAGSGASEAINATFIGTSAGLDAVYSVGSLFIGAEAGSFAANAAYSLFIGGSAGFGAINADNSAFIGNNAGAGAENASYSLFLGFSAGGSAINAKNSVFIGTDAGLNDTVDNTVTGRSIAIGDTSGTGGFSDSISLGTGVINSAAEQLNIGNALYGTGLYKSTFQSAFPRPGSSIGIGMVPTSTPTALGSEKITNGTFTGNATGWTLGTGWAYNTNLVRKNANGIGTLKQTSAGMVTPLVAGEYYELTYTISTWTVGSVYPVVGGTTLPTRGANGTYTETFQAVTTDDLLFNPTNTSRFYVDNVSLKKVSGAGDLYVAGNLISATAGKGMQIKSGTGARAGEVSLVAGTATVMNSTIRELISGFGDIITLTKRASGGTIGTEITYTINDGVSFTINSDNPLDTSVFNYVITKIN